MTAKRAGRLAALGFWRTLRRLRDQWVLLVFLATALFWMRDTYEEFVTLPGHVAELQASISELREEVTRLDVRLKNGRGDRTPVWVFPGTGHAIDDGQAGAFVTVRLSPAMRVRDTCRTIGLAAFMVDAGGRWFSIETDLEHLPHDAETKKLAFAVRVHPRMAVGRAQFLVQLTEDCSTHIQVDRSPRLHFRVLTATVADLPAN